MDLDSLDRDGAIIYNRDRLVALAVKLADPEHEPNVGNWHVEFYARQPGRTFRPFVSLDALIQALRLDGETVAGNNMARQPLSLSDKTGAAAGPIEIIEVKTEADGNAR
ncbi:MAG TPA: hypothetical protein DEP91_05910 [Sphingomonas bacterium]|uniref:Uncharacterized protein n=1 Tax=Sphingomonas bacterium TaxID=1895847 RepID=A0A3D0WAB5_9SPHN|nr:hypothetical protein [Sphingomonas bacterium]